MRNPVLFKKDIVKDVKPRLWLVGCPVSQTSNGGDKVFVFQHTKTLTMFDASPKMRLINELERSMQEKPYVRAKNHGLWSTAPR